MTYYAGKKSYVGIKKQAVAGTAEVAPAIYIATEEWPSLKMETPNYYAKEFRAAMGGIQNVYRKSNLKSSGSIVAPAYTNLLSYGFYGVLGTVGTTGDATGYIHTCTAAAATLPIWTVHKGYDTVNMEKYRDLTMKSIALNFEAGERIKATIDFEGGPVDIATASTGAAATYTALRPLDYADVAINLGTSTSDCDIESMDLTIGRAPVFGKTMCTGNTAWNANMVLPTDVVAEGSFTMLFSGYTDYELWLGAAAATTVLTDTYDRTTSDQTLTITITSTGKHIGAGTVHDKLVLTIPEILYDDAQIDPTWDDKVRVTFNWKAVHNATAETAVAGTGTVKAQVTSEVVDPSA